MARRLSPRKIKINRSYTYPQAADSLDVSAQTVRSWRGAGLQVMDSQKPHLIRGSALKDFLQARVSRTKRTLASDQFLCMSCNAPRRAYGGMADYVAINATRGRLMALCEVCEGPCGKFANPRLCAELAQILTIAIRNKK